MYAVSLLYKSDGIVKLRHVGVEDECGNGCLIVGEIRVPFPDCPSHSMYSFNGTLVV